MTGSLCLGTTRCCWIAQYRFFRYMQKSYLTSSSVRHGSSTASNPAVNKSDLSRLRKETGFAFSNCSKALQLFPGDYQQAINWLREEAAKEGWAKATKLQSRPMSQGVIGVIMDSEHKSGLMLEVNCETDFVARNLKFLSLVSEIAKVCSAEMLISDYSKMSLNSSSLTSLAAAGQTIAYRVAQEVGNLGENIQARRAVRMVAKDGQYIAGYTHTAGINPQYLSIDGCVFGKYASLVRVSGEDDSLFSTASKLGQHIVGMNPKVIDADDESSKVKDADDERLAENSDERTKVKSKDEEWRLLHQEFLMEADPITTKQWLQDNNMQVFDFARFAVGEELNVGD